MTSAESKATYAEIKAYVKDKYDAKVSNLYNAQVKADYGIIECVNYNASKKKMLVFQSVRMIRKYILWMH